MGQGRFVRWWYRPRMRLAASNTLRVHAGTSNPLRGAVLASATVVPLDNWFYEDCDNANAMPVFEIHGTNDNVTPYEGDLNNEDGWGAFLDIPTTIEYFADKNNLDQILK